MSKKKPLAALLVLALTAGGLGLAVPARAATSPYTDHVDYRVSSGIGTHDTKCSMTARVDHPYQGAGTDSGWSGSANSSFNLTETATGKLVSSFASQSSFRSGMTLRTDRSLRGSAVYTGKVAVTPAAAHLCHGVGETELSYVKVVRVPADGLFHLVGTFDDFYSLSVDVQAYPATTAGEPDEAHVRELYADSEFYEYDTATPAPYDRKVVRINRSFRVGKGEFVAVGINTGVFAQTHWSSSQAPGQPVQYHYVAENGDGGAWVSYRYHPDGNQVRRTPRKVTRVVGLPVNLGCGTRTFRFKPKHAGRVDQVTLFVNGRKVRTISRVRNVHKVRIRKGKAVVRTKLVLSYRSGARKTVKKAYYGC
ncbi:MAG TPA: hypothetical protein VNS81_09970 [Nocardioides sp.]|nr:hypothetical protein [Nocardioides sp.]